MTLEMYLKERELENKEKWREEGREEGREKTLIENLRSIMDKLNLSADNAMDFLDVPNDKRNHLLHFLNQSSQ